MRPFHRTVFTARTWIALPPPSLLPRWQHSSRFKSAKLVASLRQKRLPWHFWHPLADVPILSMHRRNARRLTYVPRPTRLLTSRENRPRETADTYVALISVAVRCDTRRNAPSCHSNASGRRTEARPCNPALGVRCPLLYEACPAVAGARGDAYGYACSRRAAYCA
jgi:hypothetical protein